MRTTGHFGHFSHYSLFLFKTKCHLFSSRAIPGPAGRSPHLGYEMSIRMNRHLLSGGYEQEFAFLIQRHHLRRLVD
jgi:hypothetical protein